MREVAGFPQLRPDVADVGKHDQILNLIGVPRAPKTVEKDETQTASLKLTIEPVSRRPSLLITWKNRLRAYCFVIGQLKS